MQDTFEERRKPKNPVNFYQPTQKVTAPKKKHLRNHMKRSWYRATGLQEEFFLLGHSFQKLFLSQRCKATAFHHPSLFLLQHSLPLLQFQPLHGNQPSCSPFPLGYRLCCLMPSCKCNQNMSDTEQRQSWSTLRSIFH